jgi:hypothetical protein
MLHDTASVAGGRRVYNFARGVANGINSKQVGPTANVIPANAGIQTGRLGPSNQSGSPLPRLSEKSTKFSKITTIQALREVCWGSGMMIATEGFPSRLAG